MTTLVLDGLVQPPREVGAQFPLNCILQLRNISWLVDLHFSFEVPPQKDIYIHTHTHMCKLK